MISNTVENRIMELVLLDLLRIKGYSRVNRHAFVLLKRVLVGKMKKMMFRIKKYAEND